MNVILTLLTILYVYIKAYAAGASKEQLHTVLNNPMTSHLIKKAVTTDIMVIANVILVLMILL